MPTSIFDNPATLAEIGARRRQIVAEEWAPLTDCREYTEDVREDGSTVRIRKFSGLVQLPAATGIDAQDSHLVMYVIGPGGAVMEHFIPLPHQPRHMPDDREEAKRQAQSPEAAFLQRLHLRIDRARSRSFCVPLERDWW